MNLHSKDKILAAQNFEELLKLFSLEIQNFFATLEDYPERLDYHPEGNTLAHTKIVTERLMDTGDPNLIIAGMFHDVGKKFTLVYGKPTDLHPDGVPQAPGHENESLKIFSQMLHEKKFPFSDFTWDDIEKIKFLIKFHMRIKSMMQMRMHKIDELVSQRHFDDLVVFTMADSMLVPWKWNRGNPAASRFMQFKAFFEKNS